MVKGLQHKHVVDYTYVFTLVVKKTAIKLILSTVAAENHELQQLDMKPAFFYGVLDKEIYMKHPDGYAENG